MSVDITQLLAFTMQNKASDLHLSAGSQPIIRSDGEIKRIKTEPLQSDDIRSMLYSVMSEDQRAEFEREMELDFAIAFGEKARFRVNAFMTRNGTAAVFRTIPSLIPSMEDLELPAIMRRFCQIDHGLVLVTGGTGAGKSTTLASMVDWINQNEARHIITIEDPVEFFHTSKRSLVNHREVGTDTKTFVRALSSALREDPDVIMVGEMRDYETISLALTAAETGHLVFATLHSSSAAKTVNRIIDVFPPGDKEMVRSMLAGSLQGIVSQNLLKRSDGKGRVGVYEILVGTNAVRNLIRENQIAQLYSMIQTGARYGMVTMEDAVNALLEQNIVSKDEARSVLMQTVEDDETPRDKTTVSAAIGGGKIESGRGPGLGLRRSAPEPRPARGPDVVSGSGDDEGGGYSF